MKNLSVHIARTQYSIIVSITLDRPNHMSLQMQALAYHPLGDKWESVFRSDNLNTTDPDITGILEMMQLTATYHRRLVRFCERMNARIESKREKTLADIPIEVETVARYHLDRPGELIHAIKAIYTGIKGVNLKTAKRLALELQSRDKSLTE